MEDGVRRFPPEALALALEPGWLEILGRNTDFAAPDVEEALGFSRRAQTLARLRASEQVGLTDGVGRRGKGGAFYWRATDLGRGVRAALLPLLGAAPRPARSKSQLPGVMAVVAIVDERSARAFKELEAADLYAELRGAVETLPASKSLYRVKFERAPRRRR